jgi:hypothetical protein
LWKHGAVRLTFFSTVGRRYLKAILSYCTNSEKTAIHIVMTQEHTIILRKIERPKNATSRHIEGGKKKKEKKTRKNSDITTGY